MSSSTQNQRGAMQFSESLALKLVSLLLSLILWITILGFKKEELEKQVSIEFIVPPGFVITNKVPHLITFHLSGPRIALKNVEKHIQPIRPDLRHSTENSVVFTVSEDLLGDLGNKVKVTSFTPSHILIRLEEVVERDIPVKPVFKGQLPDASYEVASWKVTPGKVMVSGPKSLLELLENVWTEPLDLSDTHPPKEAMMTIPVDKVQGINLTREAAVKVKIQFRKRAE